MVGFKTKIINPLQKNLKFLAKVTVGVLKRIFYHRSRDSKPDMSVTQVEKSASAGNYAPSYTPTSMSLS